MDEEKQENPEEQSTGEAPKQSTGTGASDAVKDKAKEAMGDATELAKEAMEESKKAFKILLSDPMGGQSKAMEGLDGKKMLIVGISFSLVLVLGLFFFLQAWVGGNIKLFLTCLIFPVSLMLGHFCFGQFISKMTDLKKCAFVTGVACLPAGLGFLAFWALFSVKLYPAACACGFYGVCLSILLSNASLLDVHKIDTKKAIWLTPSLLLLAIIISYVFLKLL